MPRGRHRHHPHQDGGGRRRSAPAGRASRLRDYQDLSLLRQLTGAFVIGPARHTRGLVIVP
ncbi:hypothetical protein [Streptomyces sp. WELS2]|uniref:hypothetical protein n=1 Tax=Streptomyces sp. WELS2 TaxID=2749435 RepID=UPI0015F038BE|nr:hypothetical protein [Streptomyces sp. WELS2]